MASPKFDRERALRVLVDAAQMGDRQAAERWKVSEKTVRNYRQRLSGDPSLAEAFRVKNAEVSEDWRRERLDFLRFGIGKLKQLVEQATPAQIRDVAGAVKIVGDLEVVAGALSVDQPGTDSQGAGPAAPPGHPAAGDAPAIH